MAREILGVLGHVNQVVIMIIFCIRLSWSSIFDCANRLRPFTIKSAKIIYFYINIKVNTNYISTKTLDINTLSHACYWHSCIKGILWQKLRRFKSQKREKGYFPSPGWTQFVSWMKCVMFKPNEWTDDMQIQLLPSLFCLLKTKQNIVLKLLTTW